jgi:hypothetical protein
MSATTGTDEKTRLRGASIPLMMQDVEAITAMMVPSPMSMTRPSAASSSALAVNGP